MFEAVGVAFELSEWGAGGGFPLAPPRTWPADPRIELNLSEALSKGSGHL